MVWVQARMNSITKVSCTVTQGCLYVVALNSSGTLFWAQRNPNGVWIQQTAYPGLLAPLDGGRFQDISCYGGGSTSFGEHTPGGVLFLLLVCTSPHFLVSAN